VLFHGWMIAYLSPHVQWTLEKVAHINLRKE